MAATVARGKHEAQFAKAADTSPRIEKAGLEGLGYPFAGHLEGFQAARDSRHTSARAGQCAGPGPAHSSGQKEAQSSGPVIGVGRPLVPAALHRLSSSDSAGTPFASHHAASSVLTGVSHSAASPTRLKATTSSGTRRHANGLPLRHSTGPMPGLPLLSDLASRYPLRAAPSSGQHVSLVSGQLYVSDLVHEAIASAAIASGVIAAHRQQSSGTTQGRRSQEQVQMYTSAPGAYVHTSPRNRPAAAAAGATASVASTRHSIDVAWPATSAAGTPPRPHAYGAHTAPAAAYAGAAAAASSSGIGAGGSYLAQRRAEREHRAQLAAAAHQRQQEQEKQRQQEQQRRGETATGWEQVPEQGPKVWAWGSNAGSEAPGAVGLSQGVLAAAAAAGGWHGCLGGGGGGGVVGNYSQVHLAAKREGVERWLAEHGGAAAAAPSEGAGRPESHDGSMPDETSAPVHAQRAYGRCYSRAGAQGQG